MQHTWEKRMTLSVGALSLAALAVIASAQPPGSMGRGPGMGMGRGIMMMDLDGDGKVSKEEFTRAHEERFRRFDVNGDGFIEPQELSGTMQKGMMPSPPAAPPQ